MTDNTPKIAIKIAIVGAGIAGLTAAATLRRIGLNAEIYEQAQAFARIGAGIQMNPNAMKVLRGLGLETRIRGIGFAPEVGYNREWDTGEITHLHPMGRRSSSASAHPTFRCIAPICTRRCSRSIRPTSSISKRSSWGSIATVAA